MPSATPLSRAGATLALASLALAACSGEASSPGSTPPALDAPRINGSLAAIGGTRATPAFESFRRLSPAMGAASGGTAARLLDEAAAPARELADPAAAAARARALVATVAARPVLPVNLLRTTFVWDAAAARYVADATRTDAPANGVRYVLYPVDPITGRPASTTELGAVDLTDEGAALPNGAAVRVVVTSGGTRYLDYAVSVTGAAAAAVVRVEGFATNGTDRVEYGIEGGVRAGQGALFGYRLGIPTRDFRTEAEIASTGAVTRVRQRLVLGAQEAGVNVTSDGDRVQGALAVNDVPFATIGGLASVPEVRRVDGSALDPEEGRAVRGILELTGGTLDLFGDLLRPARDVADAAR